MRRLPLALSSFVALALSAGAPIRLQVDATTAPQHHLHAVERIPAQAGPLTLFYPKWIPGEHGPTGPLQDLVGLHFTANGKEIPWTRDPVEMCAFHLEVPKGADSVEVALDFLTPSGGQFSAGPSSTDTLALLSWNTVLLYPLGQASDAVSMEASVTLPAGWSFGTALDVARQEGATVTFKPVSLTTLVDSPVLTGRHFKRVDLGESLGRPHHLDIAADSAAALAIKPETVQHLRNLVTESGALFGARHYRHYDFLLTLSDTVAHFGLEHHESSDDRTAEMSLVDPAELKLFSGLLPHEMVHSWNGKFRRPAGLATGNYDQPMKGELLWVYEGLTQYLGSVLTARSGLWTSQDYRDNLAQVAASLDARPGRDWRPLADTAVEAQVLYNAPGYWGAWRRSVDFYDEGLLIWLDADTKIRELTGGKKSLDDVCQAFHGAPSTGPEVKPYGFEDVVAALNQVAPYDWAGFLRTRVYQVAPHAPMDGITRGGWKLVYTDQPTDFFRTAERGGLNAWYSLGLTVGEKGDLGDVLPGGPAFQAGAIPGMVLLSVNGRAYSAEALRAALRAAKDGKEPIRLTVKSGPFVKDLAVDYHGGERYPRLERVDGTPDRLSQILAPHGGK
ncbi:MAG TPA: hypothetical protein VFT46_02655 [Holophagaceae bacterium]|nr:hypothetical protein [Holophagaceae bacterium]